MTAHGDDLCMGTSLKNLRCLIIAIVGVSFMSTMAMFFYSSNFWRGTKVREKDEQEGKEDTQKWFTTTDQAYYSAFIGDSLKGPSTPSDGIKEYLPRVNLSLKHSTQMPTVNVSVATSTVTAESLPTERIEDNEARQKGSSNINVSEARKTVDASRESDSTYHEEPAFCPKVSLIHGKYWLLFEFNFLEISVASIFHHKDLTYLFESNFKIYLL